MTIEFIGTTAGTVWTVLSANGKMSIKDLKKACKIRTDKDLFVALGWLAKEGKLVFEESEEILFVWLA